MESSSTLGINAPFLAALLPDVWAIPAKNSKSRRDFNESRRDFIKQRRDFI